MQVPDTGVMKEYRTSFKGLNQAQNEAAYKSQLVDPKKRRYSSQKHLEKGVGHESYYNHLLHQAEEKQGNENDYVYKSNMKNIAIRATSHQKSA